MLWQLLIVGLIVTAAAAYIARRTWRTWRRKASGCGGCGSGCKSDAPPSPATLIPADKLLVRRRNEPRP